MLGRLVLLQVERLLLCAEEARDAVGERRVNLVLRDGLPELLLARAGRARALALEQLDDCLHHELNHSGLELAQLVEDPVAERVVRAADRAREGDRHQLELAAHAVVHRADRAERAVVGGAIAVELGPALALLRAAGVERLVGGPVCAEEAVHHVTQLLLLPFKLLGDAALHVLEREPVRLVAPLPAHHLVRELNERLRQVAGRIVERRLERLGELRQRVRAEPGHTAEQRRVVELLDRAEQAQDARVPVCRRGLLRVRRAVDHRAHVQHGIDGQHQRAGDDGADRLLGHGWLARLGAQPLRLDGEQPLQLLARVLGQLAHARALGQVGHEQLTALLLACASRRAARRWGQQVAR